MTNLLLLPMDILVHIFRKLRPHDLRNLMLTCKNLRDFIKNDNRIWRSLSQEFIILQDSMDNRWYNKYLWYYRCKISNNWHRGCYKSKTLVYHYTNYMPWLKFHNSEVLLFTVGSELFCYRTDNKGIPICSKPLWKLDVPKIIRHDIRTNDISRFVLKNNVLVCGNRDGCVTIYKLNNSQKTPKLESHIKDCLEEGLVEVSAVELINSQNQLSVVTGSTDSATILFCSLSNNETIGISNSKSDLWYISLRDCTGTKSLSLNEKTDKLAVGPNGNSQPLLFDINSAEFLITAGATISNRQAIRDIHWHNDNTLVYVTHSGHLQLLDTRSHKVISYCLLVEVSCMSVSVKEMCTNHKNVYKARDPFQSSLYCVKTDGHNGIVAGSAEYSRCVLFDARRESQHVQMYFTQRNTSPVYCLDFDSTKLITAVDRGIAVLNFNINPTSQECRDYSRHVFH